ncbi:MAG: hypothetical protein P9M05_01430 [Candidatus Stygibacter australis]|nr:hypothetical protein [Candidatus Stygibacter australis]
MALEQRRILKLIADGAISAAAGAELLSTLEQKKREAVMKLEIFSQNQAAPLLDISISINKLTKLLKPIMTVIGSGLKVKFQKGNFMLDLMELNWEQLLEMGLDKDADNIYFIEEQNDNGDTISLQIKVEK